MYMLGVLVSYRLTWKRCSLHNSLSTCGDEPRSVQSYNSVASNGEGSEGRGGGVAGNLFFQIITCLK